MSISRVGPQEHSLVFEGTPCLSLVEPVKRQLKYFTESLRAIQDGTLSICSRSIEVLSRTMEDWNHLNEIDYIFEGIICINDLPEHRIEHKIDLAKLETDPQKRIQMLSDIIEESAALQRPLYIKTAINILNSILEDPELLNRGDLTLLIEEEYEKAFNFLTLMAEDNPSLIKSAVNIMFSLLREAPIIDQSTASKIIDEEFVHEHLSSLIEVLQDDKAKLELVKSIKETEGIEGVLKITQHLNLAFLATLGDVDLQYDVLNVLKDATKDDLMDFIEDFGSLEATKQNDFGEIKQLITSWLVLKEIADLDLSNEEELPFLNDQLELVLNNLKAGQGEELLRSCQEVAIVLLIKLEKKPGKLGRFKASDLDRLKISIKTQAKGLLEKSTRFLESKETAQSLSSEAILPWVQSMISQERIEEVISIADKNTNPTRKAELLLALRESGAIVEFESLLPRLNSDENEILIGLIEKQRENQMKTLLESVQSKAMILESEAPQEEKPLAHAVMTETFKKEFGTEFYDVIQLLLGKDKEAENWQQVKRSPFEGGIPEQGTAYLLSMESESTKVVTPEFLKELLDHTNLNYFKKTLATKAFCYKGLSEIKLPKYISLVIDNTSSPASLKFLNNMTITQNGREFQLEEIQYNKETREMIFITNPPLPVSLILPLKQSG